MHTLLHGTNDSAFSISGEDPSAVSVHINRFMLVQSVHFEDIFDAGNDVRLDVAYPDFYREQAIGNAQLPSPLDTQTLFSNLARQLIDDHSRSKSRPDIKGQGVHQLVQLVQGENSFHHIEC